ncbi:Hypothetical predicted protein [Octopus vulgaris]|uniref:Uncharacterized protein n=1 Tax=Octopus vulgaris TaxID=6645 RepID=A0AA36AZL0_OCTVU|nr:Hypothetical predicted protein [Octopus vulgaris]
MNKSRARKEIKKGDKKAEKERKGDKKEKKVEKMESKKEREKESNKRRAERRVQQRVKRRAGRRAIKGKKGEQQNESKKGNKGRLRNFGSDNVCACSNESLNFASVPSESSKLADICISEGGSRTGYLQNGSQYA